VDDDPIRGDVTTETQYLDWREASGIRVPHEIRILVAGREIQRQRLALLAEGQTPRDSLFDQPADAVAALGRDGVVVALAPNVYLVQTRYQSMVMVFDEFVMVLEPGGSPRDAQTAISAARRLAPGKPIRYVLATHAHYDHLAGVRPFIAAGATFLTTEAAGAVIQRAAKALHRMAPDSLSWTPRPALVEVVNDPVRIIRDGHHEVRLYQLGPTRHVEAMLFAYIPSAKALFVADALDIPAPGHTRTGGSDTQRLANRIAELGLDVEIIVPVHGQPGTIRDLRESLAKRTGVQP
jgi:glyoxylase-like metal-dependent hydrolase (beta-lactamase superfamily II)